MPPYNFDLTPNRRTTYSAKWTYYPQDVLPLWVADMDFQAPPSVLSALHAAVDHGIFGYDMPSDTLISNVVNRMKQLYNWEITPESVVVLPGLVSGFFAAGGALCQPGEGYLIQPPVYMPFNDLQKQLGIVRQEAPLKNTLQGQQLHYHIDWDEFQAAFHTGDSPTKMFLLCSPHNPTGQIYTPQELSRMAEICLEQETVIVSDEIHSELLLGGAKHTPIAMLSPEIEQNTITLLAPSKTFNTAGLFCGFAIIPSAKLRAKYKKQVERMTLHSNSLGHIAAEVAFSGACDDWLTELKAYLTANRDYTAAFLQNELPQIPFTVPDASYLMWLDCNALAPKIAGQFSSPYDFFLKQAKVALNDGATFGTGGKNYMRINLACAKSTLAQALEQMKQAIAAL